MKLITEFLYLMFLLLFTSPRHYKILEKKRFRYFPIRGRFMMWCGCLIYRDNFEPWYKDKDVWMRLNIRLYQARAHSCYWPFFYIRFWFDILVGSFFCGSWKGGYYTSPYIMEEYVKEDNQYYTSDYDKEKIKKYCFSYPDRAILWKMVSGNVEKWLKHIKEI